MVVTKKIRGYNRCRTEARQMSNQELRILLRTYRNYPPTTKEGKVCVEAMEDEALDRVVEKF